MPSAAYELGSKKHVFIDWTLVEPGYGLTHEPSRGGPDKPTSWEMPTGIQLKVHPPVIDPRPLIRPDRPWETLIVNYCTLLQEADRYRLYYECKFKTRLDSRLSDSGSMQAVAESGDLVQWTKPNIGAVSFQGSTDNNLILVRDMTLGRDCHGATVFQDPHAPASERYKMVHMGWDYKSLWSICGAVSADGLRWRSLERPLVNDYVCDTQNVMAFDPDTGKYVGYFRGWRDGRRAVARAESTTFDVLPRPQALTVADANDTPDVDIYTNGYRRWPGTSGVHLMFPAFYMRSSDVTEVHLLTSTDGICWQRPLRQPVIPAGEPGSGWEGGVYAGSGIVETPAGQWAIPLGLTRHTHNQNPFPGGKPSAHILDRGHLGLALWRKDGFMSLDAPTEGRWTTIPITFSGSRLRLNAYTPFGGEILVELAQADGASLPGFTFGDCDAMSGDVPDHLVTWQGRSEVSALAGQALRMRWRMRRASLFALQFD